MNILDILIPLYLLITLGYILNKYQFPNQDFWPGIERMTYYVLFPTLIFVALLKAEINLELVTNVFIVICIPAILSGLFLRLTFLRHWYYWLFAPPCYFPCGACSKVKPIPSSGPVFCPWPILPMVLPRSVPTLMSGMPVCWKHWPQ